MNHPSLSLPQARNVGVPMTRRHHDLPRKVLLRDSKIAQRMIHAWDVHKDAAQLLSIFLKEKDKLSHQRYWELLRTAWILAGSVANASKFRELMTARRPHGHCFSTPEDAAVLRSLPQRIELHRATDDPLDGGLAWSLDRAYVEEYREMFRKAMIISRTVDKADVFAYIGRNRESEIIIL